MLGLVLFGSRTWMCTMAAPALAASMADVAICAGVTGTAGLRPGVSAEPVTAHEMITLRCMVSPILVLTDCSVLRRLLPHRINRIRLKTIDLVLVKPIDIVSLNSRGGLRPHLFDRPPQSRTKSDCPPIFRRTQPLISVFRRDFDVCCPAILQQAPDRHRIGDAIPGIEGAIKIRSLLFDDLSPARISRLENSRTPGRDRELSARAHHAPQFADQTFHVGYEKDRENAYDGIEVIIRITERRHVGESEFNLGDRGPWPWQGRDRVGARINRLRLPTPSNRPLPLPA